MSSWKKIYLKKDFYSFECPLSAWIMGCEQYYDTYGEFLETLTGEKRKLCIESIFEISPVIEGHWMFINEHTKQRFVDECQRLDLIPNLELVRTGEYDDAFNDLQEWTEEFVPVIATSCTTSCTDGLIVSHNNIMTPPSQQNQSNQPYASAVYCDAQTGRWIIGSSPHSHHSSHPQQQPLPKKISMEERELKIRENRLISLVKLQTQLLTEVSDEKKKQLIAKITKIQKQITDQ